MRALAKSRSAEGSGRGTAALPCPLPGLGFPDEAICSSFDSWDAHLPASPCPMTSEAAGPAASVSAWRLLPARDCAASASACGALWSSACCTWQLGSATAPKSMSCWERSAPSCLTFAAMLDVLAAKSPKESSAVPACPLGPAVSAKPARGW